MAVGSGGPAAEEAEREVEAAVVRDLLCLLDRSITICFDLWGVVVVVVAWMGASPIHTMYRLNHRIASNSTHVSITPITNRLNHSTASSDSTHSFEHHTPF